MRPVSMALIVAYEQAVTIMSHCYLMGRSCKVPSVTRGLLSEMQKDEEKSHQPGGKWQLVRTATEP